MKNVLNFQHTDVPSYYIQYSKSIKNIQNTIQLQFILVLFKFKIFDSTCKLVIPKIHRTAVVSDCVLSVRHEAFIHAPQC